MSNTTINPITRVESYTDGPLEGQSVKLFVPVINGQTLNPNGVRWPFLNGGVHDKAEEYYELVPFVSVQFDPELFVIDATMSGWELKPLRNAIGEVIDAPNGHPQGTYVYIQNIKRRSVAELKILVKGYADRYNSELWPQENGYTEKLAYAKEQIAANNRLPQFLNIVERHQKLLAASFHNDARLTQLYNEIEESGETGPIDFIVGQMATEQFPEGWVNGIA
jgi:hypothetical protein